jgi:hypothetical protein
MKTNTSTIDSSILPELARQELHDFYSFLVGKYVKRRSRATMPILPMTGTAGALAASPVVGLWKDRDLGASTDFARSLREDAQKRNCRDYLRYRCDGRHPA